MAAGHPLGVPCRCGGGHDRARRRRPRVRGDRRWPHFRLGHDHRVAARGAAGDDVASRRRVRIGRPWWRLPSAKRPMVARMSICSIPAGRCMAPRQRRGPPTISRDGRLCSRGSRRPPERRRARRRKKKKKKKKKKKSCPTAWNWGGLQRGTGGAIGGVFLTMGLGAASAPHRDERRCQRRQRSQPRTGRRPNWRRARPGRRSWRRPRCTSGCGRSGRSR